MTNRTVTLSTLDHGDVTLDEPAWCAGHTDHQPVHRTDLLHRGLTHRLTHNGQPIGHALLFQGPCGEHATRDVQASVGLAFEARHGFSPTGLYDLAASLDTAADRLRDLADKLAAILAGGAQ